MFVYIKKLILKNKSLQKGILHLLLVLIFVSCTSHREQPQLTNVGLGWANNSVNVTVFRKNSLVTHNDTQYVAFYDQSGYVNLGKRQLEDSTWTVKQTQYKGNVADAHNSISVMVDGGGYLHMSWDHHGHPLRYARSVAPFSLELGEMQAMTGETETNVTYPEFYRMPNGDLIFIYRDGQSGRGNLVLNHYDHKEQTWTQVQKNLIDGENTRNAYWQADVDHKGVIHISWVWRETWDVSTNHDLAYACSKDGGKTWQKSTGEEYQLPINARNAEYACIIPQESELINQTSMTTDSEGNPYIATYWREAGSDIPQYHVVYKRNGSWNTSNLNYKTLPFSLKGGGTKSIPIARPQIIVKDKDKKTSLYLLLRDEELDSKVTVASCKNIDQPEWGLHHLTDFSVGSWEPSYDTELWKLHRRLSVFVQNATQVDGEGKADVEAEPVYVLDVNLDKLK